MPGQRPGAAGEGRNARVEELLQQPANRACADCGDQAPRWCSVNLGVAICSQCAGVHRKLGTHVSFVQSASLDTWKDEWVDKLAEVGNARAAEMYEACLPRGWSRPRAQDVGGDQMDPEAAAHLERFIRAKYEQKLFARGDLRDPPADPEKPLEGGFHALLRRTEAKEPFGLSPSKFALARGVLQLTLVTPGSPAAQWNEAQEDKSLQLQVGDCVVSVNGIPLTREDGCRSALREVKEKPQIVLSIRRPPRHEGPGGGYPALLAKNRGKECPLFLAICGKYAKNKDDWLDLLRCTLRFGNAVPSVAASAETQLQNIRQGKEPELLEAICRRLPELAPAPAPVTPPPAPAAASEARAKPATPLAVMAAALPAAAAAAAASPAAAAEDHARWPQVRLVLKRESPESPLGIVNDRSSLQERRLFVVRRVVPGSPAAAAGLLAGDVVERLGGEDAAEVAVRGKGRSTTADLEVLVRRDPASAASGEPEVPEDPFLLNPKSEAEERHERAPGQPEVARKAAEQGTSRLGATEEDDEEEEGLKFEAAAWHRATDDEKEAKEEEGAARKAAQKEACRLQAEQEEATRQQAEAEEAARRKREKEEEEKLEVARKAAEEEAARLQAEQEEAARQQAAAEEAARRKREEEAKAAEEEAARLQAEQEEAARQQAQAEEAARRKREEEKAAEEEAARLQAEQEEAARQQAEAEEAAQRKREEEEEKAAEEEAARLQAEQEEASRTRAAELEEPAEPAAARREVAEEAEAEDGVVGEPADAAPAPPGAAASQAARELEEELDLLVAGGAPQGAS